MWKETVIRAGWKPKETSRRIACLWAKIWNCGLQNTNYLLYSLDCGQSLPNQGGSHPACSRSIQIIHYVPVHFWFSQEICNFEAVLIPSLLLTTFLTSHKPYLDIYFVCMCWDYKIHLIKVINHESQELPYTNSVSESHGVYHGCSSHNHVDSIQNTGSRFSNSLYELFLFTVEGSYNFWKMDSNGLVFLWYLKLFLCSIVYVNLTSNYFCVVAF
jgi:hypothetical protein